MRVGKRLLLIWTVIGWASITSVFATHNRAGEITYEQIGELTIRVTITTYTKTSSFQADRDTLTIVWGDGTSEAIQRVNGDGDPLENDIKRNFYVAEHTYPGRATYSISFTDPNRVGGIQNLNPPNSIQIRFHVKTTFTFLSAQFQGENSSAVLLQPPIDFACVGQRFIHNPNAYDPDGDSLAYELIVPFQGEDSEVPNYLFPDQISPGANNIMTLDPITGDLVWEAPQTPGEYNVAFKILEYRKGVLLNSIIRDMQILVERCNNEPPVIDAPEELCVVAGERIDLDIVATDPDLDQLISLSAIGGPFQVSVNPAEFSIGSSFREHPVSAKFIWNTTCEHISDAPYNVVFRAVDNLKDSTGLAELKTLRIKVVGPPPENLQVLNQVEGNRLTWDKPYRCEEVADDYFKGFTVWRRENSNPFLVDSCVNGLAGRGYTAIGFFVTDMEDGSYHFLDPNVEDGISYCYRITGTFAQTSAAGFPFNLVESLPSNEDCGGLALDIPLLTKVSVTETAESDGVIQIEWTKPDPALLDTNRVPGPYTYTLLRSVGLEQQNFVAIPGASFTSTSFAGANDTSFLDMTGLNTVGEPYSYQVEFTAGGLNNPKRSRPASSIYLTIEASDNLNLLSWDLRTPWENFRYYIFRSTDGVNFDQIGTSQTNRYDDDGVINDTEYCYYVVGEGTYGFSGVPSPLVNLSQVACQTPFDAVPPCVAELTVDNACDESNGSSLGVFENQLRWTIPFLTCDNTEDVAGYRIYFGNSLESEFTLLYETLDPLEQSYSHGSEFGIAGCYTVSTLDSLGNESDTSNIACVQNCPFYSLPNVFTPNNDGANDLFIPFPYKFIERIDLKIFNRWGQLVFKTGDPDINWNGQNLNGKDLASGVYSYICQVFESSNEPNTSDPEVLTGFIELIR
ncbi:MAG: gliding motility-associated C-terminal domain-containing protein [Saprospiraceae bacterium]|nr:gliding motility-associated C-terminal domain-containing protein [Saprospiraceae bacterium]